MALELLSAGRSPTEIARVTAIPRETDRDWGHGRHLKRQRAVRAHSPCDFDHVTGLDPDAYGYLLGVYLGDGCISRFPRGVWQLRITTDVLYPGIITQCSTAIEAVSGKRPNVKCAAATPRALC
jgi:hypothetical protein